MHTKGYAAPETKAALEQARLFIERAEALGEPPEDPLLLSVLYGFWVANYVAFNGDATRELAVQFLALAEKQRRKVPLMSGHGLMGASLLLTGDIAGGRAHCDQALALYNRAEHRPLATRFGQDVGVATLSYRSFALWLLGFPEAARTDIEHALKNAREIGQAATLMYTLAHAPWTHFWIGNYNVADTLIEEVIALSNEKGALMWKALRNDAPRYPIGLNRQSSERSPNDHLRDQGIAVNGINTVDALVLVISGDSLCGAWPIK